MKKITTLILSLFLLTNLFAQTTHTVNAGSYYYYPTDLTIEVGDSVVWINDGGYHDVNGDINSITGDPFNNPETFDSPATSATGGVIFGYRFTVAGTYNYDCSVGSHAANGMVGSVIVNPASVAYTNIPDQNFEQALIDLEIDDVVDGQVLTSSINTVDELDIASMNISDLSGIEGFVELTALNCGNNNLTTIDLSQNINLSLLAAHDNQLTAIDISNNEKLIEIDVEVNQLTSLDITSNTDLKILFCAENQITDLDVSQNVNLEEIVAYENQLSTMDFSQNTVLEIAELEENQLNCLNLKNGSNTILTSLFANDNPDLTCIQVDDSVYSTTNWVDNDEFSLDANQFFSNDCNYPPACGSTPTTLDEMKTDISIYPNPSNGIFNIDLKGYSGDFNAEVFDISGRSLVKTKDLKINLSPYPSGIYFIYINSNILNNKFSLIKI